MNETVNPTSPRMVTVRIADATGHTTLQQTIDEAVRTVVENYTKQGRWPFVDAEMFQFTARSENDPELMEDIRRLKETLEEAFEDGRESVVVSLTGTLVGGGFKVTFTIDEDGAKPGQPGCGQPPAAAPAEQQLTLTRQELQRLVMEALQQQTVDRLPVVDYARSEMDNAFTHTNAIRRVFRRLLDADGPVRVRLVDDEG